MFEKKKVWNKWNFLLRCCLSLKDESAVGKKVFPTFLQIYDFFPEKKKPKKFCILLFRWCCWLQLQQAGRFFFSYLSLKNRFQLCGFYAYNKQWNRFCSDLYVSNPRQHKQQKGWLEKQKQWKFQQHNRGKRIEELVVSERKIDPFHDCIKSKIACYVQYMVFR